MSTYSKGQSFELRTKAIIEKLLYNSELELKVGGESEMWIVPKNSQTFHQKSYEYTFGLSTKTDVSIEEPAQKGSSHYLIVIECKDYNHSVGIFINRKVFIDSSLMVEDMHRYRFTLAHELGHAYLQQKLLKHLVADAHDEDVLDLKNSSKWEKRLEIQANHFAAFLLMPQNPMINIYMEVKSNSLCRVISCGRVGIAGLSEGGR